MRKKILSTALLSFVLIGCTSGPQAEEQQSSIAFRPHQVSQYQTSDTNAMMQVISKVLKEQGFTIKAIHYDLGFVSASKNIDRALAQTLVSEEYKGTLPDTLDITANLIQNKGQMKVKIHFVSKSFDQFGIVQALEMVGNQEIYHTFFEKISNYIQIKKEA